MCCVHKVGVKRPKKYSPCLFLKKKLKTFLLDFTEKNDSAVRLKSEYRNKHPEDKDTDCLHT